MRMKTATILAAVLLAGCADDGGYQRPATGWRHYDYNRPDPSYGGYDPSRYYRPGQQEQRLTNRDRIYRGDDGRYYCRRSDGTTGLVVGAIAGGILGNAISPRDSKTLGTIIGMGLGGAIGQQVDRGEVRCR